MGEPEFWIVIVALPLVLVPAVYLRRPEWLWLTLPLALGADVVVYWGPLCYYETRIFIILFIVVQMAVMALAVRRLRANKKGR